MKALIWLMLLSLASLAFGAEELSWTAADLSGLEVAGDATQNLGMWFHGDFGWLNAGEQLWVTYDAGRSWILSLTPPERERFYDSYFVNSQEGWVAMWSPLLHTVDGGASWEEVEFELIQTSNDPVSTELIGLTRIYFKDPLHWLGIFTIIGNAAKPPFWLGSIIARTEDGGHRWTEVSRGSSFPQLTGFGDQVWIIGQSGIADYTPNFGDTFQQVSITSRNPAHLVFTSPLHGWMVEVDESTPPRQWDIVETTDGGRTWSLPIFGRTAQVFLSGIQSLCLMSEAVGVALWHSDSEENGSSLLYVTYDGGESWFTYLIPILSDYYGLFCSHERMELWLFPIDSAFNGEKRVFYTSIDIVTIIRSLRRLFATWALIKEGY